MAALGEHHSMMDPMTIREVVGLVEVVARVDDLVESPWEGNDEFPWKLERLESVMRGSVWVIIPRSLT